MVRQILIAVTVVVAAPGYPAAPKLGGEIRGLAEAGAVPGVTVLHAGTKPAARSSGTCAHPLRHQPPPSHATPSSNTSGVARIP